MLCAVDWIERKDKSSIKINSQVSGLQRVLPNPACWTCSQDSQACKTAVTR